jgi:altronate hydrolase
MADSSNISILQLHPNDHVAVALADVATGDRVGPQGLVAQTIVPKAHKIALRRIAKGEAVRKFGLIIGHASKDIAAGEHVHVHNLAFSRSSARHRIRASGRNIAMPIDEVKPRTFEGFARSDGRVGTRNYLVVLATVNCSATVVKLIAERFRHQVDTGALGSIDGIVAITHQHGCSFRADGPGMAILQRTLAGYVTHPNVAGTLLVGLGCEDNQVESLLSSAGLRRSATLRTLVVQDEGGTSASVRSGVEMAQEMLRHTSSLRRQTVPASHLQVGLQCGGSDAFSGISANPALGRAVDLLIAQGGTAILSETPEIFGAEDLLLERVARPEVGEKLLEQIAWWQRQARSDQGSLDNNPSVGNKAGGLTTILEKSLGAVAKAGTTELQEVYDYAERIQHAGLVFMDSPGYDPVSATGQVAAGANLICFTTGRGSCFGCKPAPSLKLATNTPMFRRMSEDMDLNCGEILDGTSTIEALGSRIFELMLETASGRATSSERLGYGEEEFIPWTVGLTY